MSFALVMFGSLKKNFYHKWSFLNICNLVKILFVHISIVDTKKIKENNLKENFYLF